MSRIGRRWVACLFALTWVLLCTARGQAQTEAQTETPPVRPVGARLVDGVPRISFDARHFADASLRRKLKSGLPQTIVLRVVARRERDDDVLGFSAQSCRVLFDLWQGNYRVQHDRPGRSVDVTLARIGDVVERCLRVEALPVPPREGVSLPGERVYYSVAVELNPLSQATVRRIRRWLSRPAGGQLGGDAFFGSFVSIFVGKQLGSADRTLLFRSRVWVVPK